MHRKEDSKISTKQLSLFQKVDPRKVVLSNKYLEISSKTGEKVYYDVFYTIQNEKKELKDSSQSNYTRGEIEEFVINLFKVIESEDKGPNIQYSRELLVEKRKSVVAAVNMIDLKVKENLQRLRDSLVSFVDEVRVAFGENLHDPAAMKIIVLTYLHLGISVNVDFLRFGSDHDRKIDESGVITSQLRDSKVVDRMGKLMKEVEVDFFEGFENLSPWNSREEINAQKVSLDICRTVKNHCYLIRTCEGEKISLDLSKYEITVEYDRNQVKQKWTCSSCETPDDILGVEAIVQLTLGEKIIRLSFKSRSSFSKALMLTRVQLSGDDEPKTSPEVKKVWNLFSCFDLSNSKRGQVQKFLFDCTTHSDLKSDEILFTHELFKKRNRFSRFFPPSHRIGVKNVLFQNVFLPMLRTEGFWKKSYYFWSKKDLLEWSKCVFTFVSDVCDDVKCLHECVESVVIKAKTDELSSREWVDNFDKEPKLPLPFEILVDLINNSEESDVLDSFFDAVDEFFSKSVNSTVLRKYLLHSKFVHHAQMNSPNLKELKKISSLKDLNEMQKEYASFYKKVQCKGNVSGEWFAVKLRGLQLSKYDSVEKLSLKIQKKIVSIGLVTTREISAALNKFCDFNHICDLIATGLEEKNTSWSPESSDLYELNLKLNLSSVNPNVLSKTLWSIPNRIQYLEETRTSSQLRMGVSIGKARVEFKDDDHVHVLHEGSDDLLASLVVDRFIVKGADIIKIAEFIFSWNTNKYYKIGDCDCRTFSSKFIEFLYRTFPDRQSKTEFDFDGFLKKNISQWYNEVKMAKRPSPKIVLTKKFVERVKNVEGFEFQSGDLYFDNHEGLFTFMQLFDTKEKYDILMEEFPELFVLLKGFCKAFVIKKKWEHGDDHSFQYCYFNVDKDNKNRFGIELNPFPVSDMMTK